MVIRTVTAFPSRRSCNLGQASSGEFAKLNKDWVAADFPGLITEVYSNTNACDTDIRDFLLEITKKNLVELLKNDSFKEVANKFGEFSGKSAATQSLFNLA